MGLLRRPRRSFVEFGFATAAGARPDNQDRGAVSNAWAVVSDGVGGQAGGARAAELTVATVVSGLAEARGRVDEEVVRAAVASANEVVRAARAADSTVASMSATLTLAVANSSAETGSRWLVAQVGDSPAWLVEAAGARPIIDDHTLAAELVRAGAITPEAAKHHPGRHVVLRAVGAADDVTADIRPVGLRPGDGLVIVSDGVSDVLEPADVHRVTVGAPTAGLAAWRLIEAARARHTTDNVTAAVLRHLPSSPR